MYWQYFPSPPSDKKKQKKTSYNPLKRFQDFCTKPYHSEALPELWHFLKRVSKLQTLRLVWWICLDRLEFWVFLTSLQIKVHLILSECFRLEMGFVVAVLLIGQKKLKYQGTVKSVAPAFLDILWLGAAGSINALNFCFTTAVQRHEKFLGQAQPWIYPVLGPMQIFARPCCCSLHWSNCKALIILLI